MTTPSVHADAVTASYPAQREATESWRWVDSHRCLSALVEADSEIGEMDLKPPRFHSTGATVVDARIRLEPSVRKPPTGSR